MKVLLGWYFPSRFYDIRNYVIFVRHPFSRQVIQDEKRPSLPSDRFETAEIWDIIGAVGRCNGGGHLLRRLSLRWSGPTTAAAARSTRPASAVPALRSRLLLVGVGARSPSPAARPIEPPTPVSAAVLSTMPVVVVVVVIAAVAPLLFLAPAPLRHRSLPGIVVGLGVRVGI